MCTYLPYVKLGPGKYLLGTLVKQLQSKDGVVLVKTSTGTVSLEEYLLTSSRYHCRELDRMVK